MGRGGRPGKGAGKKSHKRIGLSPGVMRHRPGHKSKGGKTTLTQARWEEIKAKLLQEALKTMAPDRAAQHVEETMKRSYRLRIVRGKR